MRFSFFFLQICWCRVNGKMWDLCNFTLGTNCNSSCRVSLPIHSKLLKKKESKYVALFSKKATKSTFLKFFPVKIYEGSFSRRQLEMLRAYILLFFPYFQPIVPTFLLYESFVPFLQICWTFGLKKPQGALVLMMSWTIVALVVSAMVVNVLD